MALKENKAYPIWRIEVREEGGRVLLYFHDRQGFDNHLVPFIGKEMALIVKHPVKERSRQEEKFYHGVVKKAVAEHMQISYDAAHDLLTKLFLSVEDTSEIKALDGSVRKIRYTRVMSTTELSDRRYRQFWEDCIRWAALPTGDDGLSQDSGIELYIPYPNEVDYEQYAI